MKTERLRTRCLDIMEAALWAYDETEIRSWFDEVKQTGLKEHGFPRLCADIGILLCHGRAAGLRSLFRDMMTFCCAQVSVRQHVANDFSVKELVFALIECEASGLFDRSLTETWRNSLASFDPWTGYDCIAPSDTAEVGNWADYNMASEYMRGYAGLCDPAAFLRHQMPSQLRRFDENGMYRDPHEPMLYDAAARCQLAVLLRFGYAGEYADRIDGLLMQAGPYTLCTQSVTGELPFGGRSNQFLFNEAYVCALGAYEASRYRRLGRPDTAERYDTAAMRACDAILAWAEPDDTSGGLRFGSHLRNRFPHDSGIGCEGYAYFKKYMISLASFIYLAFLFSDDGDHVTPASGAALDAALPVVSQTSPNFHKTFVRVGDWFLEFDTDADPHYDANGLGRIHRAGVPSALCLSTPIPEKPSYRITSPNPGALAFGEGLPADGGSLFVFDKAQGIHTDMTWSLSVEAAERDRAVLHSRTTLPDGRVVTAVYTLTPDSLTVRVKGQGTVLYALPVLTFDGAEHTKHIQETGRLTVSYCDARAVYETDGAITDTGRDYANRNGIYRRFEASGEGTLTVRICLMSAGSCPEGEGS